ncbi:MAG: hypothetical protein U0T73_12445 [Chitinophagales bacterium]
MKVFPSISVILLMAFALSSCKKESPVTVDTIPPVLSMTISGGGITKTFNHTDDYSIGTFNLKPSTRYTISAIIADSGGTQNLSLSLQNFLMNQDMAGAPNDSVIHRTLETTYLIKTTAANPYKSLLLSGSFVTPDAANESFAFTISSNGRDYRPNVSNINVPTTVDAHPVGGYGWVTF